MKIAIEMDTDKAEILLVTEQGVVIYPVDKFQVVSNEHQEMRRDYIKSLEDKLEALSPIGEFNGGFGFDL